MKGLIFTEFLDYVDRNLDPEVADRLAAAGHDRYQPGANYDDQRLHGLLTQTASLASVPVGELLRRFGTQLFGRFAALYPVFIADADSAVAFLSKINTRVHGELNKLYDDVQFPVFACRQLESGDFEMTYHSQRHLADLAEGLLRGCIAHFGEPIDVRREDLPASDGRQVVRFTLVASSRH